MLHVILFQPDIPQNTGNVGRMCAVTQSRLHLIHPLGFEITDKHLRRSGMDYWRSLDIFEHDSWEAFRESPHGPQRIWLLSRHASRPMWDVSFADEDGLLFGKETTGCPPWLHDELGESHRIRVPQFDDDLRSLNLATCAGVATYEALRQLKSAR